MIVFEVVQVRQSANNAARSMKQKTDRSSVDWLIWTAVSIVVGTESAFPLYRRSDARLVVTAVCADNTATGKPFARWTGLVVP